MDKQQILIPAGDPVYKKSRLLTDTTFNFCPGCSHGTIVRIIAEVVEEMNAEESTVGVSPVGCAVLLYDFFTFDMIQAAHGRATAVASGLKRVQPEHLVFTYQGDGDLAAIGTGETIHACNRGENFTIIYVNNGIYGMTGGQMAPTTLKGMVTATSPSGRDTKAAGFPLKLTDLLVEIEGTHYITRQSVHNPIAVRKAKKAIRTAFESQKENKGTSVVEIVSTCSSGWKMSPTEANVWMEENMFAEYPLGDLKVNGQRVKR